ncbi:BppU family phage baseplate upper protein [Bacillus toyonensis]|uniref:BppU family phage baseplate upper protein n=1 Tax=Bacillus toyonensis TaxID=155322 RepID=UPI002175B584|nr:BppU family phage baseplate upper protein [Bacillus toyonensis]
MKIKLVLDINKNLQAQLNAVVTGRQGDKATVTVNVFVVDGGVPVNLTGNTIYYEGLKPNDAYVRDTSGVKMINATQGNFEYTFRPETFGVAGIGKRSYFSLEQGGTVRASTQDFGLVTIADAMTGNTMSGPYISELEELINLAQWLVDDINSRWTDINTQLTQLQNKLNGMDVVKRSGDTMTGHLYYEMAGGNDKRIAWTQGGALTWGFTSAQGTLRLNDWKNSKLVWEYDAANYMFNMMSNTNLVKKAEIYTDYLQPNGNTKVLAAGTDLNTVQASGCSAGSGLVNAPEGLGNFMYIEVLRYNDVKYVKQTATILTGGSSSRIFTRRKVNDIWESWTETIQSTGGTLTGLLTTTDNIRFKAGGERSITWRDANDTEYIKIFANNGGNRLGLYSTKNAKSVWEYNGDTDVFNINTNFMYKNFAITTAEKDGTETLTVSNATLPDSNYLLQAIRRGNTVMLKGAITVNANATALTVATLSANYRPAGGHNVRTYVTPNAGGTPAELFINGSTGAIAFNDKAKGNRIDFCITYTVN